MANSREITRYKEKVMQIICTSESIVNLLRLDGESTSGRDMRYVRIFPYAHVPDVAKDAQPYVCFEVSVPSTDSGIVRNVDLTFYIFAHQSLMRRSNGVLVDVLSAEIDELINGNPEFGLGKMELLSNKAFSPVENHLGRICVYRVKDFNRICGMI